MDAAALPPTAHIAASIAGCERKEDRPYAAAFRSRNDTEPGRGWDLLAQVFNFLFRPRNADAPFHPMAEMAGKRSMIPSDLTDLQLNAFATALVEVDDSEFRARVGDVLWLQRRDAAAARLAVRSYL